MKGIDIREAARLSERINKRWPGCVIKRANGNGPHEVRTKDGELIVSVEDFGDCLRAAAAKAEDHKAASAKRIYRVAIEAEVFVCAESEEEAEELAEGDWYEIRGDEDFSYSARAVDERDSLPWGYRDEERTIGEWLALAPADEPPAKPEKPWPAFIHQHNVNGQITGLGCENEQNAWLVVETSMGDIKVPCPIEKCRTAPLYAPVNVLVYLSTPVVDVKEGGK